MFWSLSPSHRHPGEGEGTHAPPPSAWRLLRADRHTHTSRTHAVQCPVRPDRSLKTVWRRRSDCLAGGRGIARLFDPDRRKMNETCYRMLGRSAYLLAIKNSVPTDVTTYVLCTGWKRSAVCRTSYMDFILERGQLMFYFVCHQ